MCGLRVRAPTNGKYGGNISWIWHPGCFDASTSVAIDGMNKSIAETKYRYEAFISYSHAADGELAPAIQKALTRFGRPWYSRPSASVFRDQTGLSLTLDLWGEIQER